LAPVTIYVPPEHVSVVARSGRLRRCVGIAVAIFRLVDVVERFLKF
jgi:hypothetical protein